MTKTAWDRARHRVRVMDRGFEGITNEGREVIVGFDPLQQIVRVAVREIEGDGVFDEYTIPGSFFADWEFTVKDWRENMDVFTGTWNV